MKGEGCHLQAANSGGDHDVQPPREPQSMAALSRDPPRRWERTPLNSRSAPTEPFSQEEPPKITY